MKIANLTKGVEYAKKLENALARRKDVLEWSSYDRIIQINIDRKYVIINGWDGYDPFEEWRTLLIAQIDRELVMIRGTLAMLGLEE